MDNRPEGFAHSAAKTWSGFWSWTGQRRRGAPSASVGSFARSGFKPSFEVLEDRELLAGLTITTPAAALPSPVLGLTTHLSVLATEAGVPAASLAYTWQVINQPATAHPVFIAPATPVTDVTFDRAGAYTFRATITDGFGVNVTSDVNVTVTQTVSAVVIANAGALVDAGIPFQVLAVANDQFGFPVATPPTFTWSTVGGANGRVDANGVLTQTTFRIGATTDVRASTAGARGDGVFTNSTTGLKPATDTDYIQTYSLKANADPTFALGLPEDPAALSQLYPITAGNADQQAVAGLTNEAAVAAQLADLADRGLITLPPSAHNPGETTAARYRRHAQALLNWLAFDLTPTAGQSGVGGDINFGVAAMVAYGTLKNTPGYTFSQPFETAFRTFAYYEAYGQNTQFNSFSLQAAVLPLALKFFGTDHVGMDDTWFGPNSVLAGRLTQYFVNVKTNQDTPNPPAGYNQEVYLSVITTSEVAGRRDATLSLENMFARTRDTLSPAGHLPSVGDDFGAGGTDYALFFQYGARLFGDGSYLTAADRFYAGTSLSLGFQPLLAAGVGGMENWLADPSLPAPAPAPLPTLAEVATRFPTAQPDDLIQRAGSSATAPFLEESELDTNNMGHAHPNQAGATSAYEAGGVEYLHGTGRQFLPEQSNLLVVEPANQVQPGAFPYRNLQPSGPDGGIDQISALNAANTFAGVDAAGDTYGSFEYGRYFADRTSERRQTILLPTGELIVLDFVNPSTSAAGDSAGPVWHLAGTTTGSPAPLSGTSSSGNAYFVGTVNGHNLLVTEEAAPGRDTGSTTPPADYLFEKPFGGYSFQNVNAGSQTIFARQTLQAGTPASFVSVFQPNRDGSSANDLTVTRDPSHPGAATVRFKDATGTWVEIDFTATGWKVIRSALPPSGLTAVPISGTSVRLGWQAPISNPSGTPSGYRIDTATAADFSQGLTSQTVAAGSTTFVWSGLSAGTTDYFRIVAVYATSTSGPSATATATTPTPGAPTITTAATASVDAVTGHSARLSVRATGTGPLRYTWTVTGAPVGADEPTIPLNGTAGAADSIATFSAAGTYTFTVTVTDAQGRAATDDVEVTVASTASALVLNRDVVTVAGIGFTFQFVATLRDQFGNPLAGVVPSWQLTSGLGTIDANGLFTNTLISGTEMVRAKVGTLTADATVNTVRGNQRFTVLGVDPNPVTGTSTTLHCTVTSDDNNTTTYYVGGVESIQSAPAGAPTPTHHRFGVNSNLDSTITFGAAGTYVFLIRSYRALPGGGFASGGFIQQEVTVTVLQIPQSATNLTLAPTSATIAPNATQQFTAAGLPLDQFGNRLIVTWSLDAGSVGTIDSLIGIYTASAGGGAAVVRAAADGQSVTASVTVTGYPAPTVANPATATPEPVTGTTTALAVLGATTAPGGESALTYTWTPTSHPTGASTLFAPGNGSNAAKSQGVTFSAAGSYTFQVTIADSFGSTVVSSVTLTVSQTVTTLSLTSTAATVAVGQTAQLSPSEFDQFGSPLRTPPPVNWQVLAGPGSVDQSGIYTATSSGMATVQATVGGVSTTATVNVPVVPDAPVTPVVPVVPIAPPTPVLVPVAKSSLSWYAVGAAAGSRSLVTVFNESNKTRVGSFFAFDPAFTGGVRVAVFDVNNDGTPDLIVAAGPGGGPHVKVIDGTKLGQPQPDGRIADSALLGSFFAYDPSFSGGVFVAAGHVAVGSTQIITGAGAGGGPHVKVIDFDKIGRELTNGEIADNALRLSLMAYDIHFNGGVAVAAGDYEGTGTDDVITGAGAGGGPHVCVFRADGSVAASFMAYEASFSGGVAVAAGFFFGSSKASIVTGRGAGGTPEVKVFAGGSTTPVDDYFAYTQAFRGGVLVGVVTTSSGTQVLVTGAGPGGSPHVKVTDPVSLLDLDSYFSFDQAVATGVYVGGN